MGPGAEHGSHRNMVPIDLLDSQPEDLDDPASDFDVEVIVENAENPN